MKIHTRIENGKAYLQFEISTDWLDIGEAAVVLLQVKDGEGRTVLNCPYPLSEEEPAEGILLHPHLWNGLEEPYLYKVEIYYVNETGAVVQGWQQPLALCTFEEIAGKGLFLNGKPVEVRGVHWDTEAETLQESEGLSETARRSYLLEQLRAMGANTIYFSKEPPRASEELLRLCAEKGFLVLVETQKLKQRALKQGTAGAAYCVEDLELLRYELSNYDMPACSNLFSVQHPFFTDNYYRYKGKWSREPFVHICMNSIKKQENGSFSLTVYSNQKKIALYVDGVLFEFRTGSQEYLFEEIPVKRYPAVLTAEAGECNTAATIYERSQNVHKFFTF